MPVNSRQKGKRGEREAVAFLRSIGFDEAFRSAQANGLYAGDVVLPDSPVHVEVKCGYPAPKLGVGSAVWSAACVQAETDAAGKPWVVLWRPSGCRRWNATADVGGMLVTVAEPSIRGLVLRLGGAA